MALNSIVKGLREIWHLWSIRGCIIFSLSLQIFLFLFAPLRRKTASMVVNILLWSAYLLADWVPTFTAGLILKSLSTNTSATTSCSMNSLTGPPCVNDDLLALWAASLLWHLGGCFSITAFALEDNELWFRHSTVMVVQFVTACYVFLHTLRDNKLIVPTIFALLGGFFSNVLRAHSMHLSSLDKCRKDIVMEHGSLDDQKAKDIECDLSMLKGIDPSGRRVDHMLVLVAAAHQYFKFFKGLLVNIKCQSGEQQQIAEIFCSKASPEVAYWLVSCELHFMYEMFYTNRIALARTFGKFCWLISFVSCTVVLGLFIQVEKQHFHDVDIRINNALVMVPLVLCLSAPYFFSYGQISLFLPKKENGGGGYGDICSNPKLVPLFIIMHLRFWAQNFWGSIRLRESQIKIKQDIMHKIDSTPLIFREWSESICSHNLISYCLKERPRVISRPYRPWLAWICKAFQAVRRVLLLPGKLGIIIFRRPVLDKMGLKDILDRAMYVSRGPFHKNLWDFIFNHLKNAPSDTEAGNLILEARGGRALQNRIHSTTLLHYIEHVEYDERLLLWHIATELCYNAEDDGGLSCTVNPEDNGDLSCFVNAEDNCDLSGSVNAEDIGDLSDRETGNKMVFSKMLSDYMLYLMVFQPSMMSTISGIFLKRYSVSCEQISRFHLKIRLGGEDGRLKEGCRSILDQISRLPHEIHLGGEDGRLKEACRSILHRREEFPKTDSEKDGSATIVFRACDLARELKKLAKGERWRLLSRVWLEMLVYAARNCRGDIHARSLCRGGELLTLVWLLMAHFGLIDAIVSREKKSSEQQEQHV